MAYDFREYSLARRPLRPFIQHIFPSGFSTKLFIFSPPHAWNQFRAFNFAQKVRPPSVAARERKDFRETGGFLVAQSSLAFASKAFIFPFSPACEKRGQKGSLRRWQKCLLLRPREPKAFFANFFIRLPRGRESTGKSVKDVPPFRSVKWSRFNEGACYSYERSNGE